MESLTLWSVRATLLVDREFPPRLCIDKGVKAVAYSDADQVATRNVMGKVNFIVASFSSEY
jgi:hypothetical protein